MGIQELRIGNYVEYNGCTGVVYAIHSPMPCEDEHFRDIGIVELVIGGIVTARIDEIQPIPLTEELLLRLGFYKTDEKYSYFERKDMPGMMQLYDGVVQYSIDSNDVCWIDNVHQLQNIIHSLTGEELEFKK